MENTTIRKKRRMLYRSHVLKRREGEAEKEGREGKMNEVGGGWDSERGVESDSIPARLGSARPDHPQS